MRSPHHPASPSKSRARPRRRIGNPDTLADNLASVQRLINGELSAYHTEKRYIRKDGSWLWANLSLSLVRDAKENPAYLLAIVQDINQRKEAELIAQGQQMALQRILALLYMGSLWSQHPLRARARDGEL
ncbi:MAG: PAS domain S-box protein [Iphinoe sp. HA4291-MV1]|jgi:hypothetical protein|nr:PAS domain S-box protein [Iphinoe sp. HA4291-MV1]